MGSKRAQTYRRRKGSKAALCWKREGDRRLKGTSFCLDWGTPPKTTVLLLKWQERTGNWEEMLILSLFWWVQGTPGSHTSALRAGITLLNRSAKGYTDSKTTKQWEWSDVASLGQTLLICAEYIVSYANRSGNCSSKEEGNLSNVSMWDSILTWPDWLV